MSTIPYSNPTFGLRRDELSRSRGDETEWSPLSTFDDKKIFAPLQEKGTHRLCIEE